MISGSCLVNTVLRVMLCLLISAIPLRAEEYWSLNAGSYHADRSNPLNETNLGAGYGRKLTRYCGGEAGAYWNSHDKLALYGLGFCETPGTVRAGVFLGAASGYQDIPGHVHGVIPIAGLQVTAGPVMVRVNKEVAFFSLRFAIK